MLDLAAHPAFARPWRIDEQRHRAAMDAATRHLDAPLAGGGQERPRLNAQTS